MPPLRVLSIIGTRPEAVKMAPVVQKLAQTPGIESLVCVTAQHRQMLDQVLNLFGIIPDIDLNLMRPDQSLPELTAAIFTHLDPVFKKLKPDWVLAQGDTTTVMGTALLAYYNRVRFGHVEAGLRTGDKWQPFPEEINRMVAGVVADLHFAPTEWSRQNLLKENIPARRIVVTGNPVIDALHYVVTPAPCSGSVVFAAADWLASGGAPYSCCSLAGDGHRSSPREFWPAIRKHLCGACAPWLKPMGTISASFTRYTSTRMYRSRYTGC